MQHNIKTWLAKISADHGVVLVVKTDFSTLNFGQDK